MARTQDYGLVEFTYPRGWFMVADAAQLKERALSLHGFARDLVLDRARGGRARAAEFHRRIGGVHRVQGPPLARVAAAGA